MRPGEYFLDDAAGDIAANAGRETATVLVRHTGDRPVQVGSHFHFGGRRIVRGHIGKVNGLLDDPAIRQQALSSFGDNA
jgi:urease beta subunit